MTGEAPGSAKNNESSLTVETVFNLFSIFFISTLFLILSLVLLSVHFTLPYFGEVGIYTFSIFFSGYLVVFVFVMIFYVIRFSNAIRIIYERNERTIKILALFIVVLITAIVGSILSVNEDATMKIIGTSIIVFVVALLFIVIEPIILPVRQWIENWINKKKGE